MGGGTLLVGGFRLVYLVGSFAGKPREGRGKVMNKEDLKRGIQVVAGVRQSKLQGEGASPINTHKIPRNRFLRAASCSERQEETDKK
jgi:hypothetical protein